MPVPSTSESQDLVCRDSGHNIVVEANPCVSGLVDPCDVVSAISRSALVGYNSYKLVVSRVESLAVWSVQDLVVLLVIGLFLSSFCRLTHKSLSRLLLISLNQFTC